MKKLRKLLLFVALTVIACFSLVFTGCSSGTVYKFEKLSYEDSQTKTTVSVSVGDKYQGMDLTEEFMIVIMKGDQVIVRSHYERDDESYTNVEVYTQMDGYEDEIYFVNEDGDAMVVTKEGRTLIIEQGNVTITLAR